jgi:tetratricopeptide (TPR) repeat protein
MIFIKQNNMKLTFSLLFFIFSLNITCTFSQKVIDTALFNQKIEYGKKLYKIDNDYKGAYKVFSELLLEDPNHIDALFSQGKVLLKLGRTSEALERFNKVISIDNKVWVAHYLKADCYKKMELFEEAIIEYQIFFDSDSANYRYAGSRSICYYKLGKFDEALKDINSGLKNFPTDLLSYVERIQINVQLKNYSEIIKDVDIILSYPFKTISNQIESNVIDFLFYYRGFAYYHLNQMDNAIYNLKGYCAVHPKDVDAMDMLAKAYYYSSNYIKAQECYEAVLKEDSLYGNTMYFLGNVYHLLDKNEQALQMLEKYKRYSPQIFDILYTEIAQVKYLLKDTLGAINELTTLSFLDSSYVRNARLIQLNYAFENLKYSSRSLENLNYLITHTVDHDSLTQLYQMRGFLLFRLNSNLWESDFKQALKYSGKEITIFENLSTIHFLKGDLEQALSEIDAALVINQEDFLAYFLKSFYLKKQNKLSDACKVMKNAEKQLKTNLENELNCFCKKSSDADCVDPTFGFIPMKNSIFQIENIYRNGNFVTDNFRVNPNL